MSLGLVGLESNYTVGSNKTYPHSADQRHSLEDLITATFPTTTSATLHSPFQVTLSRFTTPTISLLQMSQVLDSLFLQLLTNTQSVMSPTHSVPYHSILLLKTLAVYKLTIQSLYTANLELYYRSIMIAIGPVDILASNKSFFFNLI